MPKFYMINTMLINLIDPHDMSLRISLIDPKPQTPQS